MMYESFLKWVQPYAMNCPESIAVDAIRDAAIEFCDKSGWLRYEMDPASILADVGAYDLDLPEDTTLSRVAELYVDGWPITPKSQDELRRIYPDDWRTQSGPACYYTQITMEEVIIVPTPAATSVDGLQIIVELRPTRTSATVDDSLYEWWAPTIAAGALSRLLMTTGQPYSNPAAALARQQMFYLGINDAKRRRLGSLVRGPVYVQMPTARSI